MVVNVPSAEIPRTGWAEGEVQLELTHSQAKRVGGQLQKTADVYKFQVTVTQATVRASSHADIIIHPESDIAAKIPSHENAKEARLKVSARDERRGGVSRQLRVERIPVLAYHLEEGVIAKAYWRQAGNGAWPDRVRPDILLGRCAE